MMPLANIAFPLAIGDDGRTVMNATAKHINDMIEQLIFTNPGERVNRPDFGGGMYQVIFAPNSLELEATIHVTLLASLQQHLGDLIDLESLDIDIQDETFLLSIVYRIIQTNDRHTVRFGPFMP
jgi:phage baseplate assembly protein W